MQDKVDPRDAVAELFRQNNKMSFLHVNASINSRNVDMITSQIAGEESGKPLFVLLSPPARQAADTAVPELLDVLTEATSGATLHVCCPLMVRGNAVAVGLSGDIVCDSHNSLW